MTNLKKQAIHGVKWTSMSISIRAILQLIQLLVLARLLTAEEFGLVALVMIVIGFSQIFMDMGISNAIIHKQNITEIQLSSLYWLNIFSGLILTVVVFIASPSVADFYENKAIIPLLEVLSFSFLINSIGNQYRVLFRKSLKFNILAKIEVIGCITTFFCAIFLALNEYGAFSLIYATLANALISNLMVLSLGMRLHRPKLTYHHNEVKKFLNFGLYQMGQNSITYFNSQFDVILIGKLLGTEALGLYSLTKQLVMRPYQIINPVITSVMFPIMAKIQNDQTKLKSIYLKIINFLASLNFPIYGAMVILASTLVPLILGDKWIEAIEIFQVLSVYAAVRTISSPSGSLLLAKGRADLGFWWSISGFTFIPIAIYIGSQWGLIGISTSLLLYQLILLIPNWYYIIYKMSNASFIEYFYELFMPLLSILFAITVTYTIMSNFDLIGFNKLTLWLILLLFLYIIFSYIFNKKFLLEIKMFLLKNT
jgi:O-antigen/teichoic acid export membrane protein